MTKLVIIFFNINGTNLQSTFLYGSVESGKVLITESGEYVGGVDLTSKAYDSIIPGFIIILTIAIVLFAFSTMISWSYYGLQHQISFWYRKNCDLLYKILFLLFIIIGEAIFLL